MGKCKFNKCWLEQPEFSWLKAKPHNEFEVQCTLCKRTLNLSTLGVKALVSHTKLEKHQLAFQSHSITRWCMQLSPVPAPSSSSSARQGLIQGLYPLARQHCPLLAKVRPLKTEDSQAALSSFSH